MVQRGRIDPCVDLAAGEQCRQARGEPQPAVYRLQVKRLDAEPISRQEGLAVAKVMQRKCKHSVATLHSRWAPLPPGTQNDFGVAIRSEAMPKLLQFLAQFPVVVDTSVERDGQPSVVVNKWLGAGVTEVDNLQAPVAEE